MYAVPVRHMHALVRAGVALRLMRVPAQGISQAYQDVSTAFTCVTGDPPTHPPQQKRKEHGSDSVQLVLREARTQTDAPPPLGTPPFVSHGYFVFTDASRRTSAPIPSFSTTTQMRSIPARREINATAPTLQHWKDATDDTPAHTGTHNTQRTTHAIPTTVHDIR